MSRDGGGEERRLLRSPSSSTNVSPRGAAAAAGVAGVARGAIANSSSSNSNSYNGRYLNSNGGGGGRHYRPRPSVELSSDASTSVTELSSSGANHQGIDEEEDGPSAAAAAAVAALRSPVDRRRPRRQRCVYCSQKFEQEENRRGACPAAPDGVKTLFERLTCYPLAETLTYHCLRDAEGDYEEPCSCGNSRGGRSVARWSGLVFLSVLMPCLCFYPCLMGIYGAGRKHGICGGMHQAPPSRPRYSDCSTSTSTPKTSTVSMGGGDE